MSENTIKIDDINPQDPKSVTANWISMNADLSQSSKMESDVQKWQELLVQLTAKIPKHFAKEQEEIYYAFGENLIDSLMDGAEKKEMMIVGRIGKTSGGLITLYLLSSKIQADITSKQRRGPGTASGAKIPRPKKK